MPHLYCRNRVENFAPWKNVFSAHEAAHHAAGLHLVGLGRAADEPENVFFLFEVEERERARAFLEDPVSAAAGADAGVIEGEFQFIDDAGGY